LLTVGLTLCLIAGFDDARTDNQALGDANWGVKDIRVWGCTKDNSQHNGGGLAGWNHDLHQMRNNACPDGYQDEDSDGICQLCTTARDCGPGAKFVGANGGTKCTSAKDNTCTQCSKPMHAKYGTESGEVTSGTCDFVRP
jgi:hypothetical protein